VKAYIITTGVIFGLLVVAHVARIVAEGWRLATNPFFIFMTVAPAGLCLWAVLLLRNSARS
jgi:hypothetical protein